MFPARRHPPPGVVDDERGLHLAVAHARHGAPPQLLQQHHNGRDQLGAGGLQPVQGLGTPGAEEVLCITVAQLCEL